MKTYTGTSPKNVRRGAAGAAAGGPARRAGVTMMEMMIAVSISALVLASVAVAVDASFKANTANNDQSNLTQRSRLVMNRLMTEIRGTTAHQPITVAAQAAFATGTIVSDTGIEMLIGDEDSNVAVKYEYDAAAKKLYYTDPAKKKYVACSNVEEFRIKFEPMKSTEAQQQGGDYDQLLRATVLITLRANPQPGASSTAAAQTLTLSCSVMPRRNTW